MPFQMSGFTTRQRRSLILASSFAPQGMIRHGWGFSLHSFSPGAETQRCGAFSGSAADEEARIFWPRAGLSTIRAPSNEVRTSQATSTLMPRLKH